MTDVIVYYFGCARPYSDLGHAWYGPGLRQVDYESREKNLPKDHNMDGRFPPTFNRQYGERPELPQGRAVLVHTARYTIVSFWDRSGDKRPGSNSSFVTEGHCLFDEIIAEAKLQYPRLFKRFGFEIKLIDI